MMSRGWNICCRHSPPTSSGEYTASTNGDIGEIAVPENIIKNSSGFALDIGGSAIKLVYRPNSFYKNGDRIKQDEKEEKGKLKFALFARSELDILIQFIKDNADITASNLVHTTGVGGNEFKKKLSEDLQLQTKNELEFNCFIRALHHICQHLPIEDIFQPTHQEGYNEGLDIMRSYVPLKEKKKLQSDASCKHEMLNWIEDSDFLVDHTGKDTFFPCAMVMVGSATALFLVKADGTGNLIDGLNKGGRMFLALSALQSGSVKTFSELIEMASKGQSQNVDAVYGDFKTDDKEDIYSCSPDNRSLVAFGKCISKPTDACKNEDLVRSLLELLCSDIVQYAQLMCESLRMKRCYFVGNFMNADLVKRSLTKNFVKRNALRAKEARTDFRLIKNGGHLGALGSYFMGSTTSAET